MPADAKFDAWSAGQSYDEYMGRWSRLVAAKFLDWLDAPQGVDWLEVGCGTGALTASILGAKAPRSILATDASADFVGHARHAISHTNVRFETADAQNLPAGDGSIDVIASGLVMNFVPDRQAGMAEMLRVLRPGGLLSFYVWDYPGGGIGFIDAFWKSAIALDPKVGELDEASRFPFCTESALAAACKEAGLTSPEVAPIEIATDFPDFEAFWHPFTLGAGPAPGYCMSLPEDQRSALKAHLAAKLGANGAVRLTARAWAVKGSKPI